MELKIFRCSYDDNVYHVIAPNEDKARIICRERYGIRKNAAGFYVEEVPYVEATCFSKKQNELVHSTDYRPGLGHWDSSHYSDVLHYYCGKCGKDLRGNRPEFCPCCSSYFTKYEKR